MKTKDKDALGFTKSRFSETILYVICEDIVLFPYAPSIKYIKLFL
jgi:hypothetical protein